MRETLRNDVPEEVGYEAVTAVPASDLVHRRL